MSKPLVVSLREEVEAGHAADRQLARELGRPEPRRATATGGYIDSLGPASAAEHIEPDLVARAQGGEARARAELIAACMPLIAGVARTYRSGQVHRQELLQEGAVGVLRALERFEPQRGVPFWGYATWWVRQAMQQLVSELTRPMVLSDRALRHLARLKQAHRDAVQGSGHEPTREELSERTGLDLGQVDDLLAVERAPKSIDEPIVRSGAELGTFGELLVDPMAEDEYERVLAAVESEELHGLLAGLSERERAVLRARYGFDDGDERPLRAVGDELGLSGERVRQIERRALGKLAAAMTARP
ncbi:sigma-70 family RNA polymerase sigma factor [Solirubrobacter sp. CPCC 204708]|uniref:Sigma-70 family RNA polymerase sigma factor n=1 Tax=Solirubrobacter deserti TaxID=2282478 RepID=A0ABT4RRR6_9ACTN|nr:sigma-70 family RNA polymerase sigma factor [Solirubrobacter deserti]MBE2320710.1 sigma-70 family RNA polymerase sigma factor [Solirubrobacter deserti]MDA0140935.1 sigma-70 family RNA polymerase sigma factor [Solirubrobacter deserti]